MKIKTYFGQPILDVFKGISAGVETDFGLVRDRNPDRDWGELSKVNMEMCRIEEVELTKQLKTTLLEDLAYAFGNNTEKFNQKLKEYDLLD